jgi:hypothetical protein
MNRNSKRLSQTTTTHKQKTAEIVFLNPLFDPHSCDVISEPNAQTQQNNIVIDSDPRTHTVKSSKKYLMWNVLFGPKIKITK